MDKAKVEIDADEVLDSLYRARRGLMHLRSKHALTNQASYRVEEAFDMFARWLEEVDDDN